MQECKNVNNVYNFDPVGTGLFVTLSYFILALKHSIIEAFTPVHTGLQYQMFLIFH